MHVTDYLVHFSNILMLAAYSVRDILWLRWFAVAAALTNIPYFLLQGTVLWPPVLWALVFTAINLYQIARLYLERRPVVLSQDEQKLYVMAEGEPVSCLCIPITGGADVRRRGERIGALRPGNIIGTALALTGEPSPMEVTFTEPARYIRWSLPSLRRFMDKRPDLRVTLQGLVNRDLAGKLERLMS